MCLAKLKIHLLKLLVCLKDLGHVGLHPILLVAVVAEQCFLTVSIVFLGTVPVDHGTDPQVVHDVQVILASELVQMPPHLYLHQTCALAVLGVHGLDPEIGFHLHDGEQDDWIHIQLVGHCFHTKVEHSRIYAVLTTVLLDVTRELVCRRMLYFTTDHKGAGEIEGDERQKTLNE